MKQTAVEWLVKELNLEGYDHTVEQAKAMEKEQHEETALSMAEILLDKLEGKNDLQSKEAFEQYYNETFKK